MATTGGEPPLRVQVTEASEVVRTLEIEVDSRRVDAAYERAYRELAKRSRVRGFRPGRAPRAVLERLYGAGVAEEVERILVGETLGEAIEQSGLAVVSEPQIEAKPPVAGSAFQYTAQVEVKPQIRLGELRGLPGRRPVVEVRDEDVEGELENLRQRHAQLLEEPESVAVAEGHVVHVDFVGRIDGQPFQGGSGRDVPVEIGSGRFLPGFEEQLLGAVADSDREVRVRFPEDDPNPALQGKEAVFAVHVVTIKRREVPDLDDEFAKDLGAFDSLAALRERVRADLQRMRERAARAQLHRSLVDALLERHDFAVPPGLVERRLQSRLAMAHEQLQGSAPDAAIQAELARWREEWRPQAEREVREALLLAAVIEKEGLEVGDADVEERLETLAAERGVTVDRLRSAYARGDLSAALRSQIAEERALDFLAREAEIEEIPEA
ncbi:MAG: trigger factor [Deltaproteobacteria bacterium]|nr:MAG: trigger factor [Deltaproteobacteria bacterium]